MTLSDLARHKRLLGIWHATRVFQRAGRSGEHSHDSRDAVQRAFLRILPRPSCDPALFLAVVRREAWNMIRETGRVEPVADVPEGAGVRLGWGAELTPAGLAAALDMEAKVRECDNCGGSLKGMSARAKYCSLLCRTAAHYKRERKDYGEVA